MEKHGLPGHLVDHIAEELHRVQLAPALAQLASYFTPFERIFLTDDVSTALEAAFADFRLYEDSWYNMYTVVAMLTDTHFVVYYECGDKLLMEGEFDPATNRLNVYKFFFGNNVTDVREFMRTRIPNCREMQPLRMLERVLYTTRDVTYTQVEGGQTWKFPHKICDWISARQ